jgi:hypothetical protein
MADNMQVMTLSAVPVPMPLMLLGIGTFGEIAIAKLKSRPL